MDSLAALFRRIANDTRSDGTLLAAFLGDRDEVAFTELVRRHGPLVWGVCRRLLPDQADVEDAFQATFLVLVRRAGRLIAAPTIGPWLLKVAHWTARNARRKNARRLARVVPLPELVPAHSPVESMHDLDAALLGLSERCREAVLMCHLEGLTHAEAAARLGCPVGTVSSLASRGLARLRARLSGRDPTVVLAVAAASAPTGIAAAAVRTAVAFSLTYDSAAVPLGVAALTREVLQMFWIKKATAAMLIAVSLLIAGVGISVSVGPRQQVQAQAGPPVQQPTEKPEVPAKAVEGKAITPDPKDTELQKLQKQRVTERAIYLGKIRAVIEMGRWDPAYFHDYIEAQVTYAENVVELMDKPADKVKCYEMRVTSLKEFEKFIRQRVEVGTDPPQNLNLATAARLDAEIELLKLKESLKAKK